MGHEGRRRYDSARRPTTAEVAGCGSAAAVGAVVLGEALGPLD
jgi:hypothetical protein